MRVCVRVCMCASVRVRVRADDQTARQPLAAGRAVTGVDAGAVMIDRARALSDAEGTPAHNKLRFVVADIGSWAPDEPVDVLVLCETLYLLDDPVAALEVMVRSWLKPGGLVLANLDCYREKSVSRLYGMCVCVCVMRVCVYACMRICMYLCVRVWNVRVCRALMEPVLVSPSLDVPPSLYLFFSLSLRMQHTHSPSHSPTHSTPHITGTTMGVPVSCETTAHWLGALKAAGLTGLKRWRSKSSDQRTLLLVGQRDRRAVCRKNKKTKTLGARRRSTAALTSAGAAERRKRGARAGDRRTGAEGKGGDCKRDTALKLPRSFGRQASAALNGEHHYLVF